jgi:hypothetical protein
MRLPITLPDGKHELSDPVVRWHPVRSELDPKKSGADCNDSIWPEDSDTPVSGTTLAIHMDAEIAKDLHETLGELGRSMVGCRQKGSGFWGGGGDPDR